MKLTNYKLYAASLLALTWAFSSCSDKDDYQPSEPETGAQVYFSAQQKSQIDLTNVQSDIIITLYRIDDSENIQVPITVNPQPGNSGSNAFSFPSAVAFNAGDKTADLIITYDQSKYVNNAGALLYGDEQQFEIVIDDAYTTKYGTSSMIFTMVLPEPWKLLSGKGSYTDNYWGVDYDEATDEDILVNKEVTFYQHGLNPNLFRISNPYKWLPETADSYLEFQLLQPGNSLGGTVVPEGLPVTLVYYPDFLIDYNTNYNDDLFIVFPGRFTSMSSIDAWMYNYVVDWQENGLPGEIHLSPMYYMFNNGGWNKTTNETITILFPGYEALDTSVEVTYNGLLTKPDGSLEVEAFVKLGGNVTEAKVALVKGSSVSSEQIAAITDGSLQSISITASSTVNIPFDADNAAGKYTVVAVSYYQGDARDNAATTFQYTPVNSTPETWTLVGSGVYTYLPFWEQNLGLEPEELELYESDTHPGNFKITHWFNDQDFLFTVESDGTIYVAEEQPTGFSNGGVPVLVDDFTLWGEGAQGELEDGIYYFAVIYYNPVSGGYYAYGYESFEPVTASRSASYKTRSTSSSVKKSTSPRLHPFKPSPTISKNGYFQQYQLIED